MVHYAAAALLASGLVASVNAGSVHHAHANLHKKALEYGAPTYGSESSSAPVAPGYGAASSTSSAPAAETTCTEEEASKTSQAPVYTQPAESKSESHSAPVYSAPSSSSSAPVYSTSEAPKVPEYSAPAPSKSESKSESKSVPVYSASSSSAPVYSAPSSSVPVYSAPSSSAPVYSAPSYSAPSSSAPSSSAPVYSAPSSSAPVYSQPSETPKQPEQSKPAPSYSAPSETPKAPEYSAPAPSYSQSESKAVPAPSYSAPKAPEYSQPSPSKSESKAVPAPSYSASSSSAPAPSYSKPAESKSTPAAVPTYSSLSESCGCTTYTTTWYGTPGLAPAPSTSSNPLTISTSVPAPVYSAPSSKSSAPAPSYSSPASSSSAVPTYSAPSSSSAAPSYSKPAASKPASPKPSSGSSNGGCAEISPNGNKWAMTYTPYASNGQCKTADQVAQDVAQIKAKGFTTVRLYATDCSGPQNIGAACKEHGLNMILGVYIDSAGISKAREQVSTLTQWGKSNGWGKVEMVVVGNEAVFNGYCTASELAGFIAEVKSSFKSAGYTGPCTTTEPLNIIQENSGVLCDAMDVVGANIHPFFNTAIDASGAGDFVASQLKLVESACNGKTAYNLETGWPSAGNANGAAIPGISEQKTAINGIISSAGAKSAIFSYENDSWKAPGNLGVEQYWGCADLFQDVLNAVSNTVDTAMDGVKNMVDAVL